MNKNQKDYINSINEIKLDEEVKRGVLNKMKEKERRNYRPVYLYATMVIVFVLIVSIALPLGTHVNETDPIKIVADNGGLPKVGNFKNLYKMLDIESRNYNRVKNSTMFDLAVAENAASAPGQALQQEMAREEADGNAMGVGDDYSTTNVQVEGVDEADIVKTDGKYIYYISNMKLVIVDARDPEKLKILSEVEFKNEDEETFTPQELYINGDKVILIGTKYVYNYTDYNDRLRPTPRIYWQSSDVYTVAKIYNVENKGKVKLEREIEIEGYYLTSRMIGENVYFMANKSLYFYAYDNIRIQDLDENEFKPKYIDTAVNDVVQCIEFPDIAYFPGSEDQSYLNIAGFNVNNNAPANIETYLGAGDKVYVSEDNIYVTNTKYEYKNSNRYGYYNNYIITTHIYKFNLKGSKVTFDTVGSVPGSPLNQFSMDEKDGYFRIATTNSTSWEQATDTNNMYVLNKNLEIVGRLEDLAKGERIYSVRFMGDRAYMVTFVQVDPLFVIDLSNPVNPRVLGELKIPGYSTYLHPYDENHIIGFGEDTETVNYGYGDVALRAGMKMALFDVTDPNNPKELYSEKIGDRGTYSELLNNHKALLFSKEKNIIAFPVTIVENPNNSYNERVKFQGAIVYGLDLETGFTIKGQIAHVNVENGYRGYDYDKQVERIIYIKDVLFTLSKGMIKATDMNEMEEVGKVEIEVSYNYYYPIMPLMD